MVAPRSVDSPRLRVELYPVMIEGLSQRAALFLSGPIRCHLRLCPDAASGPPLKLRSAVGIIDRILEAIRRGDEATSDIEAGYSSGRAWASRLCGRRCTRKRLHLWRPTAIRVAAMPSVPLDASSRTITSLILPRSPAPGQRAAWNSAEASDAPMSLRPPRTALVV